MKYIDRFLDWYGRNIILGLSVKVGEYSGYLIGCLLQFISLVILTSIVIAVILMACIIARVTVDLVVQLLTGVF
jgi:hypothetical protein